MPRKTKRTSLNPIKAFNLFGKKPEAPKPVQRRTLIETERFAGVTWINVENPTTSSLEGIGRHYELQPIHTSKSLTTSHIARIEVETNYIFLLLHFPSLDRASGKIKTHQVIIFLGHDYLITVHDHEALFIKEKFEDNKGKKTPDTKTAARIFYHLLAAMLDSTENLVQKVSLELDEIGESVFDDETSDAKRISQLRQKIMQLRRTITTQKSIFSELDDVIDRFGGEHLGRYYTAITNRSAKIWENIEEARETIEIYKDADFTSSQEHTNEILAILTIIFTLSIPATTIGALYGMNVLLPGGIETGPWNFFGQYTTLICIVIAAIIPALLMYVYFKKNKWF